MVKHLPSDALKTLQKTLLYSKKTVYFVKVDYDGRNYNSKDLTFTRLNAAGTTAKKLDHARDLNIDERISISKRTKKRICL